ncbi:MAG: agmatine deiminase family protein [Phycisphaerales bacterium]
MTHRICAFAALTIVAAAAIADDAPQNQPVIKGDQLVFPADAEIPRSLTEAERRFLSTQPLVVGRGVTPPPMGGIECVAEYEPMDGIMLAWQGSSSWRAILAEMSALITTTGDATVYMYVENGGDQSSANASLTAAGADMGRVEFIQAPLDTIWIRDYGPRYIYEGDVRAIVDHTYNRPRPNDNNIPSDFSARKDHTYYKIPLIHGGGNYHLDALGSSYSTELIVNENPGLSQSQIVDYWRDYQNLETTITDALPSFIDSTQHIDMWMIMVADDTAIISNWPTQSGTAQDIVCDTWAANLQAAGYTVFRIPAVHSGGTHYTFTNAVMCNDLVIVPSYTNGTAGAYNAAAKQVWENALPGKTIVQVDSQAIVTAAGVLHCICMHVPEHRGGVSPTALVRTPNGGEVLDPGQTVSIEWASDDDVSVSSVDLLFSSDGGATFPTTIATGLPVSGSYNWTVPSVFTTQGRIRAVARDGVGNTGFDDSDGDFNIDDGLQVAVASPPTVVAPGVVTSFDVTLDAGSEAIVPGSAALRYRFDGGAYQSAPLTFIAGGAWRADLPAAACDDTPEFYVEAEGDVTGMKFAPLDAPASTFAAQVGEFTMTVVLEESFEGGLPAGWTASGLWNVTSSCGNGGACDGSSSWAYYGQPGTCDFDTGGTNSGAISTNVSLPALPPGGQITLTYCSALETEDLGGWDIARFEADGGAVVDAPAEGLAWDTRTVDLSSLAGQTVSLEWSFDTVDNVNNDFRGWLIDNVRIEATGFECQDPAPTCPGDADGDNMVDFDDLNEVLIAWGTTNPAGDLNGSGFVDFDDLNEVLMHWGTTCP